jgi:hypothetical protein
MKKYIIIALLTLLITSCAVDETLAVSTETSASSVSHTIHISHTQTLPPDSSTHPETQITDPLLFARSYGYEQVFYYNSDTETVYLVINGEIKDSLKCNNEPSSYDKEFKAVNKYGRDVILSIPPTILIDNIRYTAFNEKITKLKFTIDGEEIHVYDGSHTAFNTIYYLDGDCFIAYIRPELIKNAEEIGFTGKAIFTYNPENNTFEGVVSENDETALSVISKLYSEAQSLMFYENDVPYAKTRDELEELLYNVFTDDTAKATYYKLTNDEYLPPQITETDGKLTYNTQHILLPANIYFDILSITDDTIEVRIISFTGMHDYKILYDNLVLKKTDNGWRISQNPLDYFLPNKISVVRGNYFFSALSNDHRELEFDTPDMFLVNYMPYTYIDGEFSKVRFFIDGKEMEFLSNYNEHIQYVIQTGNRSFETYLININDDGKCKKAEFIYNPEINAFEGTLAQNADMEAENLTEGLYLTADSLVTRIVLGHLKKEGQDDRGYIVDDKFVMLDGYPEYYRYLRIREEGFRTKAEFLASLEEYFTPESAQRLYNEFTEKTDFPIITEIDGELYSYYSEGAHGGDEELYMDIVSVSDEMIECKVVWIFTNGSPYRSTVMVPNVIFVKTEKGWRISQNPMKGKFSYE